MLVKIDDPTPNTMNKMSRNIVPFRTLAFGCPVAYEIVSSKPIFFANKFNDSNF